MGFDLKPEAPFSRVEQEAVLGRPLADGRTFEEYQVLTGTVLPGAAPDGLGLGPGPGPRADLLADER